MNRNDEPYIPPQPICPVPRGGGEFTIKPDHFDMAIGDGPTMQSPRYTHIRGYFYPEGGWEQGQLAATELVEIPPHSPEAVLVRAANRSNDRRDFVERVGEILCDRVMNCRGKIEGECWALGSKAVVEAINQAADES